MRSVDPKSLEHTYCVIMAGGKGERFWPVSTDVKPKPFIKLVGERSMIQLTVDRISTIVPRERIFVVLVEQHVGAAREQLPDLPIENLIIEPEGRDTAPCVGFSAVWLSRIDPEAVMVTLPADHYIPDVDRFRETIVHGIDCAAAGDYLVTIGIKPTRPETGYGYIRIGEPFEHCGDLPCYRVQRIVEKPDLAKAEQYLEEQSYYWNAGIFIWRVPVLLKELETHMPALYQGLSEIRRAWSENSTAEVARIYGRFEKKSIDYGLMEKARNVLVIPSLFGWDDVGTWTSLKRVKELDGNRNFIEGRTVCLDTENCIIYGNGVRIGTVGISNLVVVASREGVLVCGTDRVQEVREIARRFEASEKEPVTGPESEQT
jgi:mannose-1-phosphate guanylyltransferase